MASFQKTLNLDVLTVKTIYARGPTNTNIPANNVLTTDGLGGTLWTSINSIVQSPYFNTIVTSASTYTAKINMNSFSLLNSDSAGIINVPTANNTAQLYAKAFGTITADGYPSLSAFDPNTNTGNNTLKISGIGGINVTTNPVSNTISIDGSYFISSIINLMSTFIYQYNDITSTINQEISSLSTTNFLNDNSASTISSLVTYFNDITSTINQEISSLSTANFFDNSASTLSTMTEYFNEITSTINNDISSLSTANFLNDNSISTLSTMTDYFNDITSTINNDISTLNYYNKQPFIQYGQQLLPNSGTYPITSSIIVLSTPYINTNFITQLTYTSGTNNANLLATIQNVSSFTIAGSSNTTVNWTTFGNPL
jgi:hypothetical protein